MLNREQKSKLVHELQDRLGRQRVAIFTNLRGISVAKLSQFRRGLKKIGAEFKVTKKTLLSRALASAGPAFSGRIEPKKLAGEVGIIFGYKDQAAPAKAAARFSKENEGFKILKGILGEKILEAAEVLTLARLPSREELLGELGRAFQSPIQGLVNVLQGNIRNLVVVLSKVKSQKPND
ncbi:MAG: 50S ribosomal protein L10 [Candidatus Sungbacteria bacterium]|uniref:Large ribosomal subunit protein uL10 n=1 Tax=Candidatus Sungiibacteriota bacterium TaxID=2750080 RepID=A0A933DTM3_9BACT|nr:50S ribosomal protein L10 [Candidatus Sungbacteria bacterium]